MDDLIVFAPDLTAPDRLVLKTLADDITQQSDCSQAAPSLQNGSDISKSSKKVACSVHGNGSAGLSRRQNPEQENEGACSSGQSGPESSILATLKARDDPQHDTFEPTVFVSVDLSTLKLNPILDKYLLQPYIRWARRVVRKPTDVVMVTHLILYFTTSVPSALYLFWNFTYLHGILHSAMQFYYVGTYTLMMHQHIHMRGILAPRYSLFDRVFPYITDPLMGHTWNTYFYHHVKHHHVEGNGPDDLSSTLRYQRDNVFDFLHYLGRFYFFVWLELPLYFLSKRRLTLAAKAAFWEIGSYVTFFALAGLVSFQATLFVFIIPVMLLRVGLMVGNWGQHAFVDHEEPDSDFRSSITLIDVAVRTKPSETLETAPFIPQVLGQPRTNTVDQSNRYCFNDGYHTSHHLNPLRHWRDHPAAFIRQKGTYAKEGALVFHNIDYLMITVRLLMKDYEHLARCLVPIGDQISMSMEERAAMLRRHARRFSEAEIRQKFPKSA